LTFIHAGSIPALLGTGEWEISSQLVTGIQFLPPRHQCRAGDLGPEPSEQGGDEGGLSLHLSPLALGRGSAKIFSKKKRTNAVSAMPDPAPHPTATPAMSKYPAAINIDLFDSEHRYQGSDQFTGFSSYNGQSVQHHNEVYLITPLY
jgi:hypothetical protein